MVIHGVQDDGANVVGAGVVGAQARGGAGVGEGPVVQTHLDKEYRSQVEHGRAELVIEVVGEELVAGVQARLDRLSALAHAGLNDRVRLFLLSLRRGRARQG
ncbi:MAG: hypothetical protein JSR35_10855 [Proteobacteria bacterium]|nr:hypothetical protein [Pseudomonadota bacterium]